MITKQEFELAASQIKGNLMAVLPQMISYKSNIQRTVLDIASNQELEDVRDCRINQSMIDKLCRLARNQWLPSLRNMTGVLSILSVTACGKWHFESKTLNYNNNGNLQIQLLR